MKQDKKKTKKQKEIEKKAQNATFKIKKETR